METPVHSVEKADGDDTDNVQEQQGLVEELQEADGSPVLYIVATMYRLRTDRGNVRADSPALATTQPSTCSTTATGLSYRRGSRSLISTQHGGVHKVGSHQRCTVQCSVFNNNGTDREPYV